MRNTEQQSDHIYYTLFCRCTPLLRHLPATATSAIMLSQNHFREPNSKRRTIGDGEGVQNSEGELEQADPVEVPSSIRTDAAMSSPTGRAHT
jgi:hypothetical protein